MKLTRKAQYKWRYLGLIIRDWKRERGERALDRHEGMDG